MSRLIQRRTHRNPRLLVFYGAVIAIVAILIGGLAFHQLFKPGVYSERERLQNLRRVVSPGPRGNLYDREGRLLVGNRPRFSVVLDLAELRPEFRAEYKIVARNYAALAATERPNSDQLARIARTSVAQRYLDQINLILRRNEQVRSPELNRHINQSLLLPYVLLDDLAPEEYARLIERLPVTSPLQVYTSSTRHYPYGSAAAHTLGYVGVNNDPEVEDFPGEDLLTFKMKGSVGRTGLEKIFDTLLEGETGGAIYRVDPAGYKVDLPVEKRMPVQGKNITTSIDIELQQAAEAAMKDGEGKDRTGAAVALDIRTGEVLALVSKPDYDLNQFVPRLSQDEAKAIEESGGWLNRAIQGQYPPGSTFKIITALAGLRAGAIDPAERVMCPGFYQVGNRRFPCHNRNGHGERDLRGAIRDSCNVYFYKNGLEVGPNLIAAEAKRFGFNHATGIELPYEFKSPHVADPAWRAANWKSANLPDGIWRAGDTANIAIGQGDTLITPLQAACMVASFARGETETRPTILHDPKRPRQRSTPIGLSPSDYNAVLEGMEQCYQIGSGKLARVDGLRGAAKTGTAQLGRKDMAWVVAFAPVDNPQVAVAVMLEGAVDDNNFGGGVYAGPVAAAILRSWQEKRDRPVATPVNINLQ
ncbi:Stage V sporulation protein D [Lacunisphaera limnophila]|uniref:Stage V sporulation protein D n=1 Tax=Lacunisphaera limnophila TaxID=1838286 RepID=A0A1D8AZZ5_9BACT|nr:penicillin-binding transpeptidase domain-containing protein [Lacunisphaera limnophila]AOS46462.1 Stage V sporulation protein D [Lacunisphaera limnophila]